MVRDATRAALQMLLTLLELATDFGAFWVIANFVLMLNNLNENYSGPLEPKAALPCIRSTLDACAGNLVDSCSGLCCPSSYSCARSPLVGLYCQDAMVTCGDHNWCRDFADIPGDCSTEVCRNHRMVREVMMVTLVLCGAAAIIDVLDVFLCLLLSDCVKIKAVMNMTSGLVKLVAFGVLIGASTESALATLATAQCFDDDGQSTLHEARQYLVYYAVMQVVSSLLSLALAPLSAYYGGKLQGLPYVK